MSDKTETNPTSPTHAKYRRIALVGNPNTGKTTLFNALTGLNQKTGNYSGVTVERKVGYFSADGINIEIVDLPGTYSLAARSPDEMVVSDLLLGNQAGEAPIELIVAIVDASNAQRNLYLLSQLLELGLPVIAAFNMTDIAESKEIRLDYEKLAERLMIPVVAIRANRSKGIDGLKRAIHARLSAAPDAPGNTPVFPDPVNDALSRLETLAQSSSQNHITRPELLRALIDVDGCAEERMVKRYGKPFKDALKQCREAIAPNLPISAIEAKTRYEWIGAQLDGVMQRPDRMKETFSDKLDRVVTHKIAGIAIFVLLMGLVFQSIYSWAGPIMDLIDGSFAALGEWVGSTLPDGTLKSLIVDGAIAGVGGVLIFLPQICILFLFIGILDDCGYMPRAAFLMDRVFSRFGLSGKSFIPMLSSFACAIPGIMATRSIENPRDRLTTILVAPLMSCSARLPVYIIFISAFVPDRTLVGSWLNLQGVTLFAMYWIGILVAVPVAYIIKKYFIRGAASSFLMELPPYKVPDARTVGLYVYDRARAFIVRAGTVIFCVSIVVWALAYFPRSSDVIAQYDAQREQATNAFVSDAHPLLTNIDPQLYPADAPADELIEAVESDPRFNSEEDVEQPGEAQVEWLAYQETINAIDSEESGELLRQSFLGRMGHWVEPVVAPLGWDWRIGMATIASFPAREVIIATLGTILNVGGDVDEESTSLRTAVLDAKRPDGRPLFTLAVALSIMVFFALCCQCAATLATIYRETVSWSYPIYTFVYMTGLAYVCAFITYHVAVMIGLGA